MKTLRFGFTQASVGAAQAVEDALLAERAGFDAVWIPDHFVDVDGDRLEPWTVLAAVAVQSSRIELGSAVTDTQRSHPSRTAHAVASLDVISKGRALLGIGAGEAMNVIPFGLPWEEPAGRAARLEEAIRVIKLLWGSTREARAGFDGTYYNLKGAFLNQAPHRKPHPPVYVGAMMSKRTLEIVGREGDGWIGWFNTPDVFKKKWKVVEEAARRAGRDPARIDSMTHLMMALPRTSEEMEEAMLGAKSSLLMEKGVLQSLGYTAHTESTQYQNLVISKERVKGIFKAAEEIPDEYVHRSMAVGTLDDVRKKIDEYSKAGINQVSIIDMLAPKTTRTTLQMVSKVIQEYRQ